MTGLESHRHPDLKGWTGSNCAIPCQGNFRKCISQESHPGLWIASHCMLLSEYMPIGAIWSVNSTCNPPSWFWNFKIERCSSLWANQKPYSFQHNCATVLPDEGRCWLLGATIFYLLGAFITYVGQAPHGTWGLGKSAKLYYPWKIWGSFYL